MVDSFDCKCLFSICSIVGVAQEISVDILCIILHGNPDRARKVLLWNGVMGLDILGSFFGVCMAAEP